MLMVMNEQSPPDILSFVIRFVIEASSDQRSGLPYRGTVRHIQADEEIAFSNWEEVVAFIQDYVPLEDGRALD